MWSDEKKQWFEEKEQLKIILEKEKLWLEEKVQWLEEKEQWKIIEEKMKLQVMFLIIFDYKQKT